MVTKQWARPQIHRWYHCAHITVHMIKAIPICDFSNEIAQLQGAAGPQMCEDRPVQTSPLSTNIETAHQCKRHPHLCSLQLVMHCNLKYLWKVKFTDIEMMTRSGEVCPSFRLLNVTRVNTRSIPHLHTVTSCVYLVFQCVALRQMIFHLRLCCGPK